MAKGTEGRLALTFRRSPVATALAYAALIGGSIVFFLPFLWLVSTSVKVDRELFSEDRAALPQAPNARSASPFIDADYYRKALTRLTSPHLESVKGIVREAGYPFPPWIDRGLAETEIAKGLLRKMENTLPSGEWEKGGDAVAGHARRMCSRLMMNELLQNVYRRFALSRLSIRSYSLEEQELGRGLPASQKLVNLTPATATLVDAEDFGSSCAVVRYDFGKGDKVILEQTFRTDFDLKDLHRVQLSVRPDDNWQRLTLTVEKLGGVYEPVRPVYLANFDWQTIAWQEPGPDDQSNRIKSWIHLRRTGDSPVKDPNSIKVRVCLQKTTQARAWWGKLSLNYIVTAQYIPFLRYLSTTLYLIVLNVVLTLLSCSIVAYSVSRLTWPGRDFTFLLMLATMMVPAQVTMIPGFLIWKNLGCYNTLVPLWLGSAFGSAFNIFLLRQFMKGIPRDVEDAARIDGCGILRVYWHIILPLVKPTLSAIALFTIIGGWNDFKGPLLFIADQRLYSLAFGLYAFSVQVANNPAQTMAASILMTMPIILLFFFAQKHFLSGITITGVKG